jgi:hypothetical protein
MIGVCDVPGCGDKASITRCEAHYRCDDCGAHGKDAQLCTYSEGVLCDKCHVIRVTARIAGFDGDTDQTDEIVCPYCGYVESDSWEYPEGKRTCCDCERLFTVEHNTVVTYTTRKEGE